MAGGPTGRQRYGKSELQGRYEGPEETPSNLPRQHAMEVACTHQYQESAEESEDDVPTWDDDREGVPTVGETLSETQKEELTDLFGEFSDVFQVYPGCTNITEHSIDTGDAAPVRLPPYRLPHAYLEQVQQELKEMLHHGIIDPSQSDWAAPMVLVKKMGLCGCASITGMEYHEQTRTPCLEWMTWWINWVEPSISVRWI